MSPGKLVGRRFESPTGDFALVIRVAFNPGWVVLHVWPSWDPEQVPIKRWVHADEVSKWKEN